MKPKLSALDTDIPIGSLMKITNGFVVLDEDGESHSHDLFKNQDDEPYVFANQSEIVQTINDYNREHPGKEFTGSIIVSNVLNFWK